MLNFTWNVFSQTGNVDTYLLFKELEKENMERPEELEDELARFDYQFYKPLGRSCFRKVRKC